MELAKLTEDILKTRTDRQKTFAKEAETLDDLKSNLELVTKLDNAEETPLWSEVTKDCRKPWQDIAEKSSALLDRIKVFTSEDGVFTLAKARADRSYVNIGTIGIVGEGKSVFIAKATKQFNDNAKWVLPRRAKSAMVENPWTSAPINIINGETPDGEKNVVRVYFYTVKELAETFRIYISELGLREYKDLEIIETRKELLKWCEKNITEIKGSGKTKGVLLAKFIKYLEKCPKYINYVIEDIENEKTYKDFDISKIIEGGKYGREYYSLVSYYDNPDATEGNEIYTSFATRKADIFTTFTIGDEVVPNIQFLDTPGIGEQKVGIEKALADAVSMKLDIIIVMRAINGQSKEGAEQDFLDILRRKLAGKEYAAKWIYYMLNVWDNVTYNQAKNRRKTIQEYLSQGDKTTAIALPDSHFGIINLVSGYTLQEGDKGDKIDTNQPIEKFLSNILNSVIPFIPKIDDDFFKDSDIEYNEIISEYKTLHSMMASLDVPSYSNDENIQKLIKRLSDALAMPGVKTPKIMDSLEHNIDDFCHQTCGTLTARSIGVNDLKGVSSDNVVALANVIRPELELKYQEADYEAGKDFVNYTEIKLLLMDVIAADIKKRINPSKANQKLKEVKENIANIFITVGEMGFISKDPSDWYIRFMEKYGCRKEYSQLVSTLKLFFEWDIDVQRMIEPKIKSVTRKCLHQDYFVDDPTEDSFDSYDNAITCIVRSLCKIEEYAQGLIRDDMIKKDIEDRQKEFESVYYAATRLLTHKSAIEVTKVRKELESFYKKNPQVFEGDDLMKKQGLVSQWEEMLKI